MYSRLDPIFKTQMRQAESLDTRQGIRRHDPDFFPEKEKEKQEEEEESDLWEDQTVVSVRALRAFLEQLVKEASFKQPEKDGEDINISAEGNDSQKTEKQNDEHVSHTRKAAHAAKAYQKTYNATHQDEETVHQAIPHIQLSMDEIRTISQLIKDLSHLEGQHIEYLTLYKSASFIQSLVNAVDAAKNSP